ncbi:hypothetical protein [Leisingera caerulea]|uniref:hypothetical protein n=1 Tax=Leisingera caerulea TaxID=506591 RepID=UPI0021A704D1|nr:hypothetical protein [Leisingera caerulea]UWQ84378.1 hypothetical protein K3726_04050 [Leisingera caerulea]
MEGQNDFFTLQSLGTFAGATGATLVISNSLQRVLNRNPAWLALLVAEVICIATVFFTHGNASEGSPILLSDYFVAVVNGFLVFCSAAGSTSVGGAVAGEAKPATPAKARRNAEEAAASSGSSDRRNFFTPWF